MKGNDTYKPVPFFMSLRGYGVWVDTYSDAIFDLNVTRCHAHPHQRARQETALPAFRRAAIPHHPGPLHGAWPAGRNCLPYWAFAPWKARDYHRNQQEVNEDIDRYRKLGLPASVILIDSPWATNYNTYEFNPKQFDNAPEMVRHLHDEGYKLVLWHTSWINQETAVPGEDGFKDKTPDGERGEFRGGGQERLFAAPPGWIHLHRAHGGRAAAG